MTRSRIYLVPAMLTFAASAGAQVVRETGASPFAKDYTIDFAIPDAPAFELLAANESFILRPQTVRDLGVAIGGFRGNNSAFVIPRQLAVEFSPGLLIGAGKLTLNDYAANRLAYATRLSGAVSRDSLNRAQFAAGLRLSLVDEQDIRAKGGGGSDPEVTRLTGEILKVYRAARLAVGPAAALVLSDVQARSVDALGDSIRQHWADKYWNATSLEFAVGARASSTDSLGHDLNVNEVAAWITYANGLQGWGQLLLGGKLAMARETNGEFHSSNALAARLYVGSNVVKAFVEGQQAISSKTDAQWLFNSGVEARLSSQLWLNASAGLASDPDGDNPRLISSFKLKTALLGM